MEMENNKIKWPDSGGNGSGLYKWANETAFDTDPNEMAFDTVDTINYNTCITESNIIELFTDSMYLPNISPFSPSTPSPTTPSTPPLITTVIYESVINNIDLIIHTSEIDTQTPLPPPPSSPPLLIEDNNNALKIVAISLLAVGLTGFCLKSFISNNL